MKTRLFITQIKSSIGYLPKHRATLKSLGLRKINHTVVHAATPDIRGKVKQISYMVNVVEELVDAIK
ncbi:MAG: 50S ribosomal protein L30 [Candidatus Symbiodolus clandestinus]